MIFTTHSHVKGLGKSQRGFTLVELLVATFIGGIILAAVISCFLFIGRSSANIVNYSEMEEDAQTSLEQFAQDTRQASAITWNSTNSITLVVDAANVTYTYSSADGTLVRSTSSGSNTLITGITEFSFVGYTITGGYVTASANLATTSGRTLASNITKQLQISLKCERKSATVTEATNTVLSARFTLRNKRITA